MSLKPGEDIGAEVHKLDQFFRVEKLLRVGSPAAVHARKRTARQVSREGKHHQGGCRSNGHIIEDGVVGPGHQANCLAGA